METIGNLTVSDERREPDRAEEPASGSSHALLVQMVRQEEEICSEEGIDGYDFSELSESLAASGPWKSIEPQTLEDFNCDFFSLMCNVGDCDAVALAAIDTQG